ncbi:MAG: hypothetical protein ACLS43_07025 [Evtepia gabavorous]
MKLLQLTATFGCLQGDTLNSARDDPSSGPPTAAGNPPGAPSCGPCSTAWTPPAGPQGAPADKNRYRPWSGSPMEGLLV